MSLGAHPMLRGAVVGFVIAFAIVALRLATHDWDPSIFVHAGPTTEPANVDRVIRVEAKGGFDGQFFYRLALDPLTTKIDDRGIPLDMPEIRSQRILLPAMVWTIGWGSGRRTVWALIGANVVAMTLLFAAAAGLAENLKKPMWWGVALAGLPGTAVALTHDTSEVCAAAAARAGCWRCDGHDPRPRPSR